MLLTSMCRAMPFSAGALNLKKIIWRDKKQMEMWIIVACTIIDNEYESLIFLEHFFSRCFFLLSEFADVYEKKSEEKSDAYK